MNAESIEQFWDINSIVLKKGNHAAPNGHVKACAMEACYLRWCAKQGKSKQETVAGWTDSLACVDPVIGGFIRSWNDSLADDASRTRIFTPELLDMLPGTKGSDTLMLRRMWMACDWDIRTRTVAFLRLAKLDSHASAIANLPEINSQASLDAAHPTLNAAGDAARAAAWYAAGDAAWYAAGDAAGDAAWYAARSAAGDAAGYAAWYAARSAARYAAGDAARAAARSAAWYAARDAAGDTAGAAAWYAARSAAWYAARSAVEKSLSGTVSMLQDSAADLIKRMCARKE